MIIATLRNSFITTNLHQNLIDSSHQYINILQMGDTWTYVILIPQGGISHG
jgi:hypothetical protein